MLFIDTIHNNNNNNNTYPTYTILLLKTEYILIYTHMPTYIHLLIEKKTKQKKNSKKRKKLRN